MGKLKILTDGLVKENPVLRLVLGTCPTLALTTAVSNAFGMGFAATFVLVCSNIAISALRKVIPGKVPAGLHHSHRHLRDHRAEPGQGLLP